MPKKLDRCVKELMSKGHSESSAFAICTKALGKAQGKGKSASSKRK